MNCKTDLFFIILLVVVVSIIIGLNIAKLVDNKINDVAINIPTIKVPKPEIIIQVSKNDKNKFVVCSANSANEYQDNKNKSPTKALVHKEKFTVADAHDFHNYDKIKNDTINKYSDKDFKDQNHIQNVVMRRKKIASTSNTKHLNQNNDSNDVKERCKIIKDEIGHPRIIYPSKPVVRVQEDGKSYVTDYDFGFEGPTTYISCANSSIAEKWKTGKKSLLPYQIGCNKPNKLTAENYYKVHNKIQVIPIIDYHIRGHNYMEYINSMSPYKIDYRILSQSTKGLNPLETQKKNIPEGYNHVDESRARLSHYPHNAPVRAMP